MLRKGTPIGSRISHIIQFRKFPFSESSEQFSIRAECTSWEWHLRFVSTHNFIAISMIDDHSVWLAGYNNWWRSREDTLRYFSSVNSLRSLSYMLFIHDARYDCSLARSGSIIDVSLRLRKYLDINIYSTCIYTSMKRGWIWKCKGYEDKEGNGKEEDKIILIVQQWTPSRRPPLQSYSTLRSSHRTRVRQLMNYPSALQCRLVVILVV